MSEPGALVLVATPIGNLGDLSPRAIEALRAADVVACEDTRRTGRLLHHFGIDGPRLVRVDDHTEARMVPELMARIRRGERVAVVTDAGTPGISDPGERLVRAAVREEFTVDVVPGPSAAVAALVASGLPTGRFVFEGFLPRRGSGRTERLGAIEGERRTMILYEAPHRLARTLADLADVLGDDRQVAIARELTKLHEEVWRGTIGEARQRVEERRPVGEFVLVIAGAAEPEEATDDDVRAAVREELAGGASARDAAAAVARRLGVSKRRAYEVAIGGIERAGP